MSFCDECSDDISEVMQDCCTQYMNNRLFYFANSKDDWNKFPVFMFDPTRYPNVVVPKDEPAITYRRVIKHQKQTRAVIRLISNRTNVFGIEPEWMNDCYVRQGFTDSERKQNSFTSSSVGPNKIRHNMWFAQKVAQIYLNSGLSRDEQKQKRVLLLDSKLGLTTSTVQLATGMSPNQIHVPNPFASFDQPTKIMTHFDKSIFEYTRDLTCDHDSVGLYVGIGLDYCCSFRGSYGGTLPYIDIRAILSRRLPSPSGCVIWTTFSLRAGIKGWTHEKTIRDITKVITETITQFGYLIQHSEQETYKGQNGGLMFRFCLTVFSTIEVIIK